MAEQNCSTSGTSIPSMISMDQQSLKDVSKVFALLRAKLNAKEKELLELQRAQPCLLAPGCEQTDAIVDAISSLHLSTQEGSFLFTSEPLSSPSTSVPATGVDSIKTLPSSLWLSRPSSAAEEKNESNPYRLPMVTHLLSLPMSAYVASSSTSSPPTSASSDGQVKEEPSRRLPLVNELLSMPISAFRSTSAQQVSNDSPVVPSAEEKNKTNEGKPVSSTKITCPKSILDGETVYSKEYWLAKSSSMSAERDAKSSVLDLDAYIEQASEKMRRLHSEYLAALGKLQSPLESTDSSEAIKSLYPNVYQRVNEQISPTNLSRMLSSNK